MTDPWYGHRMADEEVHEFLNEQAIGVLSLARDRHAYGIPMSFAYDVENERAIMDFGFAEDSRKREFLETTEEACLTVYDWDSPREWTSVVVHGTLEHLPDEAVSDFVEAWYHRVAVDIDVPGADVDLEWYALAVESASGVACYE